MADMHFVMPWHCDDCVVQEEEIRVSDTALPSQSMASLPNPKKEKLANCHDQPCWKGTFEILDGNSLLTPYQGVWAHLSCDVNPKVVNFCKSLPEKVELKELPLSKVWPKIFDSEPPNTDDVALYFFCDTGRPREKYIRLVQRLDLRDHALKAKIKGAQLLLFSSKKLPANSQKTKEVSYLWGIIRFSKSKGILKDSNVENTISTPKQKKQIRFDLLNLPPEKRSADISINAENNVSMSFDGMAIKKNLLIPNIGPPPGFPEMPIKLAKCIGGSEMNNCFIKTEDYMKSTGTPPGCTKIDVKQPFALPLDCCECLRGVKNGSFAMESDEKVDKVTIKRATCTEDINFGKPNFVQSPRNKGATSTMIKYQNASIVCAKTSDSENASGGNPNSRSPVSSSNKENTFLSLNSAETGILRSNAKAQPENSGKVSGKNMFGVNFSIQKYVKSRGPVLPFFLENSSYTDSGSIPSNSLRKTHASDTCEDGLVGHTKGNCATRDKEATEEKSSSRSSGPLTEQCFQNRYIGKNSALTVQHQVRKRLEELAQQQKNLNQFPK